MQFHVGAIPNEPDIQLILKIRKRFGKYQPVFLINPKKILWKPCTKKMYSWFISYCNHQLVKPGKRKDSHLCDTPYQNSKRLEKKYIFFQEHLNDTNIISWKKYYELKEYIYKVGIIQINTMINTYNLFLYYYDRAGRRKTLLNIKAKMICVRIHNMI